MWQTRLPREMCVDESVLEICSVLWMSLSFELLMYACPFRSGCLRSSPYYLSPGAKFEMIALFVKNGDLPSSVGRSAHHYDTISSGQVEVYGATLLPFADQELKASVR